MFSEQQYSLGHMTPHQPVMIQGDFLGESTWKKIGDYTLLIALPVDLFLVWRAMTKKGGIAERVFAR